MTDLDITGMTCKHCQRAVTNALEAVEGVQGATVDLAPGSARVEGNVDIRALIAAVEGEGYQATPVSH